MELSSNYSHKNLSGKMSSFLASTPRESQVIRHRNMSLGLIGIGLNLAGVILLILSRDIRATLKIPLISLSVNDVMFVVVVFFRGTLRDSPVTTNHPACWPSMYLCYTSIMISYLTISQLSFQNYIAVFVPLRCHEIVTNVKVVLTIASIWMTGFLVVLGCFGLTLPGNQPCISLIPISSPGIGVFAGTCTLCACLVAALNLRIFIKIRKLNRTVSFVLQDNGSVSNRTKTEITSSAQAILRRESHSAGQKTEIREESSAHASNRVDYFGSETKNPNSVWVSPSTSNIVSHLEVPQEVDTSPRSRLSGFFKGKQPHSRSKHDDYPCSQKCQKRRSESRLVKPNVAEHCCSSRDDKVQVRLDAHNADKKTHAFFFMPASLYNLYQRETLRRFTRDKGKHCPKNNAQLSSPAKLSRYDTQVITSNSRHTIANTTRQAIDNVTRHAIDRDTRHAINSDTRYAIDIDTRHMIASDTRYAIPSDTQHSIASDTRHTSATDTRHAIDNDTRHTSATDTRHTSATDIRHTIDNVFQRANEEKTLRRHGTARVRNTLLIVTFWCCLLTLPFLISLVILMTNQTFEKVTFAQSNMGIFLSSLVTCSALTNPILYAWRFVQWRKIILNFRKFRKNKCDCKK